MTRKMHQWTDEERDYVRLNYRHTHESSRRIGRRLGVSEFAVRGQVAKLGLTRIKTRFWSPGEESRLEKLALTHNVNTISNLMKRSTTSIVLQMRRMGLSRRDRLGWYTKREACEMLGVDHKWIQARIDSGQLPASYHNGRRPSQNGSALWHIEQADLREFVRRYPQEFQGRNVDMIGLVDLLAGMIAPARGR